MFSFHSDLPELKTIIFGGHVFETEDSATFASSNPSFPFPIDLPKLEEIQLGWVSVSGKVQSSILVMRGGNAFID